MSIFHSTVSRRSFMKLMAATVGGMGGAAVAAPVFHDIDELLSSSAGVLKRPWYVKERDFNDPTEEIDWSVIKRRDPFHTGQEQIMWANYYGEQRAAAAAGIGTAAVAKREAASEPGYTYRMRALKATVTRCWPNYVNQGWAGPTTSSTWTKSGGTVYAGVDTPEKRGEPKWSGTPEEATKMLYAYMRFVGVAIAGFGDLDQRIRTQVISTGRDNSSPVKQVFEDVDQGYSTSTKQVIPNKPMWYFSHFENMIPEFFREAPVFGMQSGGLNDAAAVTLKPSTFNFLRYMGYQMLGDGGDNGTPFVEGAAAILTGVAEMSRQNLYCLNPEYGAIGRLHNYLTDLPLAPTKPIDAGMFRFCHSCQKCANICPSNSISTDKEPSWDLPPINGKPNLIHNTGTREFWADGAGCRLFQNENGGCVLCWGTCTFTVNSKAMAHEIVKTAIVTTPIFNSFFYKMGEAFGYGPDPKKAEDWWDLSLPVYGIDSTRVAFDGGYRK